MPAPGVVEAHPSTDAGLSTTPPKVRREIQAAPPEVSDRALAKRYGVTVDTIRRWRGRDSVEDRSHTPHHLRTTLAKAQEDVVVEIRRTPSIIG